MKLVRFVHIISLLCFSFLLSAAGPEHQPNAPVVTADSVYKAVQSYWFTGDDTGLDAALRQACRTFPKDNRFPFLLSATYRSCFQNEEAALGFMKVAVVERTTPRGQAALCVVAIDEGVGAYVNFDRLDRLASEHPEIPEITWLVAIESRSLHKNEIGAKRFEQLLTLMRPGSAIIHQTYANLLDDLNRSAEALPHRELAVKLAPADWTYDALGNTLFI